MKITETLFSCCLSLLSRLDRKADFRSMYKLLIAYSCQNIGHFQSVSQSVFTMSPAWGHSSERDKAPVLGELTGSIDFGGNTQAYKEIAFQRVVSAVKKVGPDHSREGQAWKCRGSGEGRLAVQGRCSGWP